MLGRRNGENSVIVLVHNDEYGRRAGATQKQQASSHQPDRGATLRPIFFFLDGPGSSSEELLNLVCVILCL